MSAKHPKTLAEWRAYTAALSDEALHQEAAAANSARFVRSLQEEGYSAEEIHGIFIIYAHRFKEQGLRPPSDGLYDYFELMQAPLPAGV